MILTKGELLGAMEVAAAMSTSSGPQTILANARFTTLDESRALVQACDGSNFVAWYIQGDGIDQFDFCVHAKRMLAFAEACHNKETLSLTVKDGKVRGRQPDGPQIALSVTETREFPVPAGFDTMVGVYDGPNPYKGLSTLKQSAITHAGTTPLYGVVICLPHASYAIRPGITVRCDFSLVDRDTPLSPVVIQMNAIPILKYFGTKIRCMADDKRLLVIGDEGYAVLRRAAVQVGTLPEEAPKIFGSLVQHGEIQVDVKRAMPVVKATVDVLRPIDPNAPLYVVLETEEEIVKIHGVVNDQEYRTSFPALCSGRYRIPLRADRFLAFLKSSSDDRVHIKVMDSDRIPDARRFVHLVDSRLHEVVGIDQGRIEELS